MWVTKSQGIRQVPELLKGERQTCIHCIGKFTVSGNDDPRVLCVDYDLRGGFETVDGRTVAFELYTWHVECPNCGVRNKISKKHEKQPPLDPQSGAGQEENGELRRTESEGNPLPNENGEHDLGGEGGA